MIRYPDGNVLLRNLDRSFPVVSHGEGVYLYDTDGKRYFDGSSGALVASLGHGNKVVAEAVGAQLARVAYVNGMQFTSQAAEDAAKKLCALAPKGLARAAFLGSGSEAVEAALKFARQLCVERAEGDRGKIVARTPGYHGNTLFALSASGRPHYKKWFGPFLSEVLTISAPYAYRGDYGADHYAAELDARIKAAGPETVCAFIFEPVIGSSAGAATPPKGYFEAVREVCTKHGVLIIADEVLCGAGRTGSFFASSHPDLGALAPDIIVLGKGLSGGYVPTSAVIVREDHLAEMKKGSGYFMHAQTYLHAPSMAASVLATLDYMQKHDVVGNAARVGKVLQSELRERMLPLSKVGNVAGIGMLAGVEFVADKAAKTPFARKEKVVERFVQAAFDAGLIVWPNTGHADGTNGDLVMVGPPLIASEPEVKALVSLLADVTKKFFS
ncbi:MAG: aminotransferase class III-fold pyridoxal phosphate-dependent enzyme [Deltaproteobacteria bacterium]|nr:aminotransferase class III-fold pyridoxal phosphate-dependent enzyme [Deltaproteobacteria bacterium]